MLSREITVICFICTNTIGCLSVANKNPIVCFVMHGIVYGIVSCEITLYFYLMLGGILSRESIRCSCGACSQSTMGAA